MNQETSLEKLTHFSLLLSIFIFTFFAGCLVVAACSFFLGISTAPSFVILALIISTLISWIGVKRYFPEHIYKIFGCLVSCIILIGGFSFLINRQFADTSIDGQAYQTSGVLALATGWNPFLGEPLPVASNHLIEYVNDYPKAIWIIGALIFKITNHIADIKAVNLIILASSFFLCLSAILSFKKVNPLEAILLSTLINFNPVIIYQLVCLYVDGCLAAMLNSLLAVFLLWYNKKDRYVLFGIIAILITTINIKQTGMIYALIFAGVFSLLFLLMNKQKNVIYATMIGIGVGIFLVGYNPYITNTIRHKNPLFPIVNLNGSETPIITSELPKNFTDLNRFQTLFYSLFSKSQLGRDTTELKIPFSLYSSEIFPFANPDPRVAGFGPFFGGSLLLSLVIIIFAWFYKVPHMSAVVSFYILLLISVLINPTSWWARFAPQFWLLPIIAIYLSLGELQNLKLALFGYLTVLILVVNILFVGITYFMNQSYRTTVLRDQLTYIKNHAPSPIKVNFGEYDINRIRFNEIGLKYIEVTDLSGCRDKNQVLFSNTTFCNR